jgi:hypothetical protein
MAADLRSRSMRASPPPTTWIYRPRDFIELAQGRAEVFEKIATGLKVLPIVHGLISPLSPTLATA